VEQGLKVNGKQNLETANSEVKESVFRELEENALQLMQDVFGNYVIQKFFEHGDQTQKKILVGKMKGHVLELANQMYACRVVQKVSLSGSQPLDKS
jgi:mRNA-binding protein PUF3